MQFKEAKKLIGVVLAAISFMVAFAVQALAEVPPVRIAVVPGGGSGMEQEVVDQISRDLQMNPKVKVSTVNPDWFVTCNILDRNDTVGQSVRVNGTVVIKTLDGHVVNTVSMQTNKQDFSLTPGMPVNKALANKGVGEVIVGLVQRIRQPLAEAVDVEIETREKLIKAQNLGDEDKYQEGIDILLSVSQDSPHFTGARKLMDEFQMEQEAMDMVNDAKALASEGKYSKAIDTLKAVNPKSKRYREGLVKALMNKYRAALAGRRSPAKVAPAKKPAANNVDAQLKALDAQKKALEAQRKALEAQEAALKKGK